MTPLNPILNPPKKAAGASSNGLSISIHLPVFLKSFRTFLICGEKIHVRRAEMIKPPRTNAAVLVYYERPVKVGVKPKSALTTSKRDKERVTTRT